MSNQIELIRSMTEIKKIQDRVQMLIENQGYYPGRIGLSYSYKEFADKIEQKYPSLSAVLRVAEDRWIELEEN